MAAEIERKFLLEDPPAGLQDSPSRLIEQGYLAISEDSEVRLRRDDARLLLTIKKGKGVSREETEVELPSRIFDELWPQTEDLRVSKTRHLIPLEGGLTAEVDVYSGDLDGLVTAEVEFASESESRAFSPPPWLTRDVTGDSRYANQTLAACGLPEAPGVPTR